MHTIVVQNSPLKRTRLQQATNKLGLEIKMKISEEKDKCARYVYLGAPLFPL